MKQHNDELHIKFEFDKKPEDSLSNILYDQLHTINITMLNNRLMDEFMREFKCDYDDYAKPYIHGHISITIDIKLNRTRFRNEM